jgi:CheY-like chemotaxis protein
MWIHLQEDNKVNQMVAVRLLNALGCTVTVACNGIEALSILECPSTYDIIFMDCHMPVILTENALMSLLFLPKTPYRILYPFNSLQNAQV